MNPAALIFDMDGTLLDTEPYYARAFALALADVGLPDVPGLYAGLVGIASPDRTARLLAAYGLDFPLEGFMRAYYARRAACLPARIPLRPGAAALLAACRRPRAIATSASRRTALRHLASAGIDGAFAAVVTRDDVPAGKPAPDAFLLAAALLRMRAADCLAIEDSLPGVLAAQAAGMAVALIDGGSTPVALEGCVRLASLGGLAAMLGIGAARRALATA